MYRKIALGLIGAAALSATALLPSDASAKGWKHHHGFHHHGFHGHWGPRVVIGGGYYGGCYVKRLVETPYGLRYRTVNVCF